ncbi:unnamed protein product [Rotaria socialis]|uniref:Uncharacterized protein n=1 Tax=Rotaria socialis TaxID=392032 RepID=A0A818GPP4_9BILA|nr:unnamed protein product [Rotaria socialis]
MHNKKHGLLWQTVLITIFFCTSSLDSFLSNNFFLCLDEDIDGATLLLLQQEDIVKIFPRIKDRVKFVDQRTKLIESFKEHDPDTDEITDVTHHHDLPDSPVLLAAEENQNGQTRDDISSNIDCNENNDLHVESRLPTDYTGPILTTRIQYYIDQNNLSKFNPHTTLRGEILSLLFDDVTKTYNLLYPNHDEYMIMAKSIVEKLSTPSALACEATKEWHESIKQKFKRERRPLQMDNKLVKLKQTKYNHGKENGRPKRKSVVAQAQRRTNDIPFINLNDRQNENLSSLVNQMNIELLKDNPDNNILHNLWSQSFNIRRLHVRELTIDELLERFPGYRRADLLLAEVKETAGIDLNENIDTLLPKFFECLPDNNCYLSDVLPIRIIRILCKRFGDSLGNVFTYQEVLVPYPCIKILEDKFELYLDFHLVAETNSCSTAVALLLSLYHIFEIRFANHNRCCRLLYSILFEDAHHLNKSLKNLLNNWNYKIINRPLIKAQTVIMNMTECFTQPSTDNENISSSSNNFTQIDDTKIKQTQQTRRSSSCSALTTSKNSVQDCLNPICENDYDQSSDFSDENVFNHSSTTSIPMNDSQLKSSMALQNVTQSLINTQRFSEDRSVQEKHELYAFKTPLQATENELQPDPPNENTISNSNLKQKRKQSQSSYSSTTSQRQSSRLGAKRIVATIRKSFWSLEPFGNDSPRCNDSRIFLIVGAIRKSFWSLEPFGNDSARCNNSRTFLIVGAIRKSFWSLEPFGNDSGEFHFEKFDGIYLFFIFSSLQRFENNSGEFLRMI